MALGAMYLGVQAEAEAEAVAEANFLGEGECRIKKVHTFGITECFMCSTLELTGRFVARYTEVI